MRRSLAVLLSFGRVYTTAVKLQQKKLFLFGRKKARMIDNGLKNW